MAAKKKRSSKSTSGPSRARTESSRGQQPRADSGKADARPHDPGDAQQPGEATNPVISDEVPSQLRTGNRLVLFATALLVAGWLLFLAWTAWNRVRG